MNEVTISRLYADDNESESEEYNVFTYLGFSQLLNNATGFGSVQKALAELYFSYLQCPGSVQFDKQTVTLETDGMTIKKWNPNCNRLELEFYPYTSVTYSDSVHFELIAARKKCFGYFRRYQDSCDIPPESALIPIAKGNKFITHVDHKPIVVCILRRPEGIQFLDCHVFLAETKLVARSFTTDLKNRTEVAHRNHALGHSNPQLRQPRVWKSQPCLTTSSSWISRSKQSCMTVSPSTPLTLCSASADCTSSKIVPFREVCRTKSMASLLHNNKQESISESNNKSKNNVFYLINKFEFVNNRNPTSDQGGFRSQINHYSRPKPLDLGEASKTSHIDYEAEQNMTNFTSPRRVKQKSKAKRSSGLLAQIARLGRSNATNCDHGLSFVDSTHNNGETVLTQINNETYDL